jgi:1,4-alpha-glucan branching enzyme
MQYWRIGGKGLDLGQKPPYEAAKAANQVKGHAQHFSSLVSKLLADYQRESGRPGVISSAYDTELFGHWWFEGVDWLKEVLRLLAADPTVELTTATKMIEDYPPTTVMNLPESSWGAGGGHQTWLNEETEWLWPKLHEAERRMEAIVKKSQYGDENQVLKQVARELLLLESSDWPFLITTGQAKEYATKRFNDHLRRFNDLAEIAEQGGELSEDQLARVAEIEEKDNPFPAIDYRQFAERQGSAAPFVKSTSASKN